MLTIEEIRKRIKPICEHYNVKKTILFGSYSKGNATELSDVDLYFDIGVKGLKFVGMIENIREVLENKEIDALDKTHISEDSLIAMEIKNTGVELYAKWNYHRKNDSLYK